MAPFYSRLASEQCSSFAVSRGLLILFDDIITALTALSTLCLLSRLSQTATNLLAVNSDGAHIRGFHGGQISRSVTSKCAPAEKSMTSAGGPGLRGKLMPPALNLLIVCDSMPK
ncbi:MAG: hypothetical protein QOD99_1283 [Chthoniobacter sp.]|nr:hypothetical protein [Chthoniobacter sp.]